MTTPANSLANPVTNGSAIAPDPVPSVASSSVKKRRLGWRGVLRWLHRDLGYLCVGMLLLYAISGIALNHRRDWNPYHSETVTTEQLPTPGALLAPILPPERAQRLSDDPTQITDDEQTRLVALLSDRMGEKNPPTRVLWRGPRVLRLIFGERGEVVADYALASGQVQRTTRTNRFLLRDFSVLHKNSASVSMLWIGDIVASLLLFLSISGALIVKGKRGLWGRGGVLLAIGLLLPIILVWLNK